MYEVEENGRSWVRGDAAAAASFGDLDTMEVLIPQ